MKIVKGCISYLFSEAITLISAIWMSVRTVLHNVLMVLGLIVAGIVYIMSLIGLIIMFVVTTAVAVTIYQI